MSAYMNLMIGIGILCLTLILFPHVVYAEKYYYYDDIEEYGLIEDVRPTVCAFDFEDENMSRANNEALIIAEKSVQNWNKAFNEYTNYPEKWQLEFIIVPMVQQTPKWEEKWDMQCTIIIYFYPKVDKKLWDQLGMEGTYDTLAITDNFGQVSDLHIVYRELVYEGENDSYYNDLIDYELEETIDHEIGHAFSLDHPTDLTMSNFEPYVKENEKGYKSYSTMVTPTDVSEELIPLEYFIFFEITEYDIRSLENLYGENGFEGGLNVELDVLAVQIPEPIKVFEPEVIELTPLQTAIKDSVTENPKWFPISYLLYLKEIGLLL